LLDIKRSIITEKFTEDLWRRLKLKDLGVYFGVLPIIFLLVCILSTIYWLVLVNRWPNDEYQTLRVLALLFGYSVWVISQGGLGACAFIGTQLIARATAIGRNAPLSAERSVRPTTEAVDLTDENYLRMRIVLGSLFAFLLCFPIARLIMDKINTLFSYEEIPPPINANDLSLIIVPFIVGFSTSLVLTILNRFISAIQEFFGASDRRT
jgi:hypothetical protein